MKYLISLISIIIIFCKVDKGDVMKNNEKEKLSILKTIDFLEESANKADPSIAEPYLLLEDDRFSEIEDFIQEPFGAKTLKEIHDWVRKNGKPGDNVHFRKRKIYLLSSSTAYATSIQELNFDRPSKSRVTFVFLKDGEDWKIIHAHYSSMPRSEN